MAKKSEATDLVVQEDNHNAVMFSTERPSFLTGKEASGLEGMGRNDYNIPQLKLIHQINPEVTQYQGIAIPGEYFHTTLVKSLGKTVPAVIAVARKRILVWRPRTDNGGGIIASSNDGIKWDRGGNTKFTVKLKDVPKQVEWDTKGNVLESGLLNFGSSNPNNPDSPPAAVQYYEYVVYLPTHDNASPVVARYSKTGVKAAKDLNAYFLLQARGGVPIYACAVEMGVTSKKNPEGGDLYIPIFTPKGYVNKNIFDMTERMHKEFANIELAIDQPVDENHASTNTPDI